MSNYPPGVSGNEPEIAGYPETEREMECGVTPVSALTISRYGVRQIEEAAAVAAAGQANLIALAARLRSALSDIEEVEVDDGVCPFVGWVTLTLVQGAVVWTCPLCRTEHEIEPEDYE